MGQENLLYCCCVSGSQLTLGYFWPPPGLRLQLLLLIQLIISGGQGRWVGHSQVLCDPDQDLFHNAGLVRLGSWGGSRGLLSGTGPAGTRLSCRCRCWGIPWVVRLSNLAVVVARLVVSVPWVWMTSCRVGWSSSGLDSSPSDWN